jgi:iron complex transport system substrate-binding protein
MTSMSERERRQKTDDRRAAAVVEAVDTRAALTRLCSLSAVLLAVTCSLIVSGACRPSGDQPAAAPAAASAPATAPPPPSAPASSAAAASGIVNSQPKAGGASTSPSRPVVPPLTPFPRTLRDALGDVLVIPAPPQRIVSQTLGTDEILFAICPAARIAGISTLALDETYSNVLAQARASGAPAILGAEQVLRLKADLIFVASYSRAEIIEVLRASRAPIYRFANFDRLDDVKINVRLVGRAIGEDAAADALVATMERRLTALAARVKPGPRPVVMSYSGDGYTAGANTLFDDEIRAAGGINATAAHGVDGFARVSAEQLLQWNPDIIVAGAKPGQEQMVREHLLQNPAVAATRAARTGGIVTMPARQFEAASQYVVDAAETLSAAFWTRPAS